MTYPFMQGTTELTAYDTLMDQCAKFHRMGWQDGTAGGPKRHDLAPAVYPHLQRMYDSGYAAAVDARRSVVDLLR